MKLTRRNFLKSTAALGTTTTLTSLPLSLAQAQEGHKALVFIFLFGGNDAYNMLVPMNHLEYQDYIKARPEIGLKESEILDTGMATDSGVGIGINSAMSSLVPLFENGLASALINTGQLIEPTTRHSIELGTSRLPEHLMAHNLQQEMWQSGAVNMANQLGWAGRMMDILGWSSEICPLFSIGNESKLLRSMGDVQTSVSSHGAGDYNGWGDTTRLDGYFHNMENQDAHNVYVRNYAKLMSESVVKNESLKSVLEQHSATGNYPSSGLAEQLSMVSRLIRAHSSLGQSRQVFFVSIGGFDTHKNQKGAHESLLSEMSEALASFSHDLQHHSLDKQVTTVSMSDFGRRIQANDSGTDHGWGGHQLILGGAVQGGKAYGEWPNLKSESENDYSNGRVIPTIAADQVNATLANWFGLEQRDVLNIFPNLVNFDSPYLTS